LVSDGLAKERSLRSSPLSFARRGQLRAPTAKHASGAATMQRVRSDAMFALRLVKGAPVRPAFHDQSAIRAMARRVQVAPH
jgi:hypothetical protein